MNERIRDVINKILHHMEEVMKQPGDESFCGSTGAKEYAEAVYNLACAYDEMGQIKGLGNGLEISEEMEL